MMNAHLTYERLFALHDGELGGADLAAARTHLQACADCRSLFSQWQGAAEALRMAPAPSGSDAFVLRVMDRLPSPRRQARPAPWPALARWLVPAAGLAAMLMVLRPVAQPVSVETLLLSDGPGPSEFQNVFMAEQANGDDVLTLLLETAS
jgi:anti-sigma factor RsiW